MDGRNYYNGEDENQGFIDPEEYRKMRYYKNYQGYENYPQSYNQNSGEKDEVAPVKKPIKHPVLLIQVALCLLAAIAVFVIKSIGGGIYDTVKKYYDDFINTPDVITDFISENQLSMTQQQNTEALTENTQATEETTESTESQTLAGDEDE